MEERKFRLQADYQPAGDQPAAIAELVAQGGSLRVCNHVLEPLTVRLGYARLEMALARRALA